MKRLIYFLVRTKLGLKKGQCFRFANQNLATNNAVYWFTSDCIIKSTPGKTEPSGVSLNWLLDDECKLIKFGEVGY